MHCHVNAGPTRTEMMDRETVSEVIAYLKASGIKTLDITGGAPELNPHFRALVLAARNLGVHVMDRCNLTVLEQPGQEDTAQFLAAQRGRDRRLAPLLPRGKRGRAARQGRIRGEHARAEDAERAGLRQARLGARAEPRLQPAGPEPAAGQEKLEADYHRHLASATASSFNHLYVLTNMPIQRFGSMLVSKGQFEEYMELLKNAYQPQNLESVMCRSLISVDWRGYVYDCDFNQMLGLPLATAAGRACICAISPART